ncbi:Protein required for attachment to host cell [Janthinobacterium sp. KBS0711]|uniref:host attachment protein n=1 Tax=Janthinobacterium sp. KBS0711 TaxID=1649647 RepID=UPI0006277FE4|nr:host attachment protein [Janthinobacterium sp. KBS0711]KKO62295.1 Protein required for attachment to host cell [Janthinobacterium sp. KBS0711]
MDVTWVVVADSSRARLFALGQQNQLGELQDFVNPAGRETENALNSDASGRFGSGMRAGTQAGTQAHTTEPRVAPVEHANEQFARQIAQVLQQGLQQRRYSKLCLVAAPKFLGQLRLSLDAQVEKRLNHALARDVASMNVPQLEAYLQQALDRDGGDN